MNTLLAVLAFVGIVVVVVGAIPANLYPLRLRLTPWHDTATGRVLMKKAVAVALLFDVGLLSLVWAAFHLPAEYFVLVQTPVNTYVAFAVANQYVAFERRHGAATKP